MRKLMAILAVGLAAGCGPYPLVVEGKPTERFPVAFDGELSPEEQERKRAEEGERLAAEKAKSAADAAFAEGEAAGTAEAYLDYLERNPAGAHRQRATEAVVASARAELSSDARLARYRALVKVVPEALVQLPLRDRLLLTGPVGMRILDIVELTESGLNTTVIVSKIRAAEKPYGDFSAAELSELNALGVDQDVVAAMIDVTAAAKRAKRDEKERAALRREIEELRELVKSQAAKGEPASEGGASVQTKEGEMSPAACVAAKLAASQGCGRLPWPASTVCAEGLGAAYPCGG